jgi:hypothetical protein
VRDQHRIEPADTRPKSLLAEIARRIDQNPFSSVFDQDGNPESFILGISRTTGFTITSD